MPRNPLLHDPVWLRERYEVDRLSTPQIARLANVPNANATTVRRALERSGIPRRTVREGQGIVLAALPPPTYTEKACTKCGEIKVLGRFYPLKGMRDGKSSWCCSCADAMTHRNLRLLRVQALEHLGGTCVECGIADLRVLAIDHVQGGGRADRLAARSAHSYYKAVIADTTGKFQALCHNCNFLKRMERGEHRLLSTYRRTKSNL